ncbi:MAG: hypothetical protein AAF720_12305 [Pseudomonadota bacterium]
MDNVARIEAASDEIGVIDLMPQQETLTRVETATIDALQAQADAVSGFVDMMKMLKVSIVAPEAQAIMKKIPEVYNATATQAERIAEIHNLTHNIVKRSKFATRYLSGGVDKDGLGTSG